jgi:hypothetical protein
MISAFLLLRSPHPVPVSQPSYVISVTDLSADVNDPPGITYECVVNQMEDTMTNNSSHYDELELSLDELANVAGGTSPIKVAMDAYNATLKEIATEQKDVLRTYVALGSTNHPL